MCIVNKWYSKSKEGSIKIIKFPLNNDYGTFKNEFIKHASGDWIFALDGDEIPPSALLGENLHALLENNPTIEAYAVPRLNVFNGVTDIDAIKWGWRLTRSESVVLEKNIDTHSNEYKFLKESGYIIEEL